MQIHKRSMHIALLLVVTVWTTVCARTSQPVARADVYLTEQGGASVLTATLERTAIWTREGFSDLDIRMKEVERLRDGERVFRGTNGPMEITADLKSEDGGTTRVVVTARKNAAEWDALYARKVLARIVKRQK